MLCKRLHNKNVVFNSKKEQVNVKGVTFAYGKLKKETKMLFLPYNIET